MGILWKPKEDMHPWIKFYLGLWEWVSIVFLRYHILLFLDNSAGLYFNNVLVSQGNDWSWLVDGDKKHFITKELP